MSALPPRLWLARLAAVLAACVALAPMPAFAQTATHAAIRSVALVIGQAAYTNAVALPNPTRDATAIGGALKDLGFEVVAVQNGDKAAIERAVDTFIAKAASADVAFVFYAGHGVQQRGVNFLLPIDASTSPDTSFQKSFISLNEVLTRLEKAAPAAAKVIVVDACRDNPWEAISTAQTGQASPGLAKIPSEVVTSGASAEGPSAGYFRIIAFSTAAGQTASDGDGSHSPYSRSLLRFLPQQGLEVSEIFRSAAADVQRETRGVQRPEFLVQTSRPLYFRAAYVTDCDRVAIEGQNFLGLPGVPFDDVDPKVAIPACEAALARTPDSARLHNNMARAYEKAERLADALKHYAISSDAGYAPAINAYGIAKIAGCGLPARQVEAGIRLVVQARELGNLSARATLTSHDFLKFLDEGGLRQLKAALVRRNVLADRSGAPDRAALAAALGRLQEADGLAKKGLTLETVHALGLYAVVPNRFRCH